MENLKLLIPDETLCAEIAAYRKAFLDHGDSMDGCGSLRRHDNPLEWLEFNRLLSKKETCPENWVPCTQFVLVRETDGRIVGMIQVRHEFNEYLEKYAGHIGYSVHPDERRKGYASEMLAEALPYCKTLGIVRVLVTCDAQNEASRRTILKNGGIYEYTVREPEENVDIERYWITL